MNYQETYQEWLNNPYFDEATKEELKNIQDDDNEIKERFYSDLAFGTAGLRGIIGAAINRMNIYVVRKATPALHRHSGILNLLIRGGQGDFLFRAEEYKQFLIWMPSG